MSSQEKLILLTNRTAELFEVARKTILEHLVSRDALRFSPRLEAKTLQSAIALSVISYFKYEGKDVIPIDEQSMMLVVRFYVEEVTIRLIEPLNSNHILFDLRILSGR
jgi:hypothetical protein